MKQVEIERKYIIAMPSVDSLSACPDYTKTEIEQIYLSGDARVTHRIRKRCYPDRTVYTETKKIRLDKMSADEREREITGEEYQCLKKDMKPDTRPIKKTRHSFTYGDITAEIDIYPEWERCAIMETELKSREENPALPPFIRILREVTGEWEYSNAGMAHAFPSEDAYL